MIKLALIVAAAFVLQILLSMQQMRHFSNEFVKLRRQGKVACGRKAGGFHAGAIVMFLLDDDGSFCALSVGTATVTATVGGYTASIQVTVTDAEAFTWYSQHLAENGGWHGTELSKVYFYSIYLDSFCNLSNLFEIKLFYCFYYY